MRPIPPARVGFVGLGAMGEPMVLNLLKAGTALLVWNRSASKSAVLAKAGAAVAKDAAEVFARCEVVIFMLLDGAAMDAVLARGERALADRVKGRTLINMATRVKGAKLVAHDFAVQAAISNVLENVRLIAGAAREAGIASPLLDVCVALYGETSALGLRSADMIAVIRAIERRTAAGVR